MKKQTEVELQKVITEIEKCKKIIKLFYDQEQEKYDPFSEEFSESKEQKQAEENVANLIRIVDHFDYAIENLKEIKISSF